MKPKRTRFSDGVPSIPVASVSVMLVFAVVTMSVPCWAGETLSYGNPAEVGISAKGLETGVTLFRRALDRDEIKGTVLLVARNGKIVLHEALGWRNEKQKLAMKKDTLFRMASNTKPVVATAVMRLAEQGKLSLEDSLGKHLPAFRNAAYKNVQIKHLLSHTSGLRIKTLFLKPLMKRSQKFPTAPNLQLEVNRFAAVPPEKKPGTTYSYNNPGYNTLGALVEVLSKQSLESFLTSSIYRPLGMKDTTNHPVKAKFDRMSVVYARNRTTGKWRIRFRQDSGMRVPFVRASGGLVSTANDYACFCQMFLNGGTYNGKRILSADSTKLMTTPKTKHVYSAAQLARRKTFYGFGWVVDKDGAFSHGGSEGTYAWVDPSRKLIVLVLTQSPGGKIPRLKFVRIVKQACSLKKS